MATRICCSFLHKSPDLKEQYLNFSVRERGLKEVLLLSSSKPFTPTTPRVNTPENVTRWEYFSGVFDCISFFTYGCPLYSYSMTF